MFNITKLPKAPCVFPECIGLPALVYSLYLFGKALQTFPSKHSSQSAAHPQKPTQQKGPKDHETKVQSLFFLLNV